MSTIQLIVTDMDGTLLDHNQRISDYSLDILKSLHKQNIGIVLASGRQISGLKKYGEQLDIGHSPLSGYITLNGMEVYDYQNKIIAQQPGLSKKDLYLLHDFVKTQEISLLIFKKENEYIISYGHLPSQDEYLDTDIFQTCSFEDIELFDDEILKAVFLSDEKRMKDVLLHLPISLSQRFEITVVEKQWVEINPKGITKGQGLIKYLEKHNLSLDEIIVFGNGENDLSMLNLTTNSVATANALDIVKKQVNYLCDHHDRDGVAKFIKEKIL